jgi:hypothetical protein
LEESSVSDPLVAIAEKLALELKMFGHCRGPVHRPMFEGKPDMRPCQCRYCDALRSWEAYVAIVQVAGKRMGEE